MPKAWLQNRKRDYYYQKAKKENYRSRAAYKLLQAVERYGFIKRGDVIVDLGAAPGGWVQVVKKKVGRKGFVIGVDLKPINPFPQEYVRTIIADITDCETLQQILDFLPRKADAVLSDVSPNISGIWGVDQARQIDLSIQALTIALKLLNASGSFFVKVFEGDMSKDFIETLKKNFEIVKVVKPKASRAKSSEFFVLGKNVKLD